MEDIVENGGVRTAMLDVSFACHMPDCLEMPYKPAILGARDPEPGEKGWRMGCLLYTSQRHKGGYEHENKAFL